MDKNALQLENCSLIENINFEMLTRKEKKRNQVVIHPNGECQVFTLENFRALKLARLESFRALQLYDQNG